ncbi:MAG: hypothetical protein F6K30_03785 [Cyanothece sp. SIO2G6]|nr:hypothetical protein [Cyanothece sp. SIO2G6]
MNNLIRSKKVNYPKRLCQGIQKFEELVSLIQTSAVRRSGYFFELAPSNITQDKSGVLSPRYTVYEDQRHYLEDVRKDSLYTKINRGIGNPYVPYFLNFIRRPIILEGARFNINKNPHTLDCIGYQFTDISPYGSMIRQKDWVIIKTQGKGYLWVVNAVNSSVSSSDGWALRLDIASEDEVERTTYESVFKNKDDERIEAVFYKNLSPTHYYLNMLGIYIYHLFFVGLDGNTPDKPQLENALRSFGIDLIEKIKITSPQSSSSNRQNTSTNSTRPTAKKKTGGLFRRDKQSNKAPVLVENTKERLLKDIVLTLTWMYLKLAFSESQDSYCSEKETLEEMLIAVRSSLRSLKDLVAQFVGCDVVELEQMSPQLAKKIPQLSSQLGVNPDSVSLSFNELMSKLIHLPSSPEQNYLKNIF